MDGDLSIFAAIAIFFFTAGRGGFAGALIAGFA